MSLTMLHMYISQPVLAAVADTNSALMCYLRVCTPPVPAARGPEEASEKSEDVVPRVLMSSTSLPVGSLHENAASQNTEADHKPEYY